MRPGALRPFESCLTYFTRPEEAAAAVSRYLKQPAVDPSIDLEPEGQDLLETLLKLKQPESAIGVLARSESMNPSGVCHGA